MRNHRRQAIAGIAAVLVCLHVAAGCGDDDDTTTTTGNGSAEQTIDSAVSSCTDSAQQLGGAVGTALDTACKSVGDTAKQAASEGGEKAQQALSSAAKSCRSAVGSVPSGQAQDALSKLCDAISNAA